MAVESADTMMLRGAWHKYTPTNSSKYPQASYLFCLTLPLKICLLFCPWSKSMDNLLG